MNLTKTDKWVFGIVYTLFLILSIISLFMPEIKVDILYFFVLVLATFNKICINDISDLKKELNELKFRK